MRAGLQEAGPKARRGHEWRKQAWATSGELGGGAEGWMALSTGNPFPSL